MKKILMTAVILTVVLLSLTVLSCSKKKQVKITEIGYVSTAAPVTSLTAAVLTTEPVQMDEDIVLPKYETVSVLSSEMYGGDLIVVDKNNPYTYKLSSVMTVAELDSLSASELKERGFASLYDSKSGNYLLRSRVLFLKSNAHASFVKMLDDFSRESGKKDIQVCYAYGLSRTGEASDGLYDESVTGLSVEINVYTSEGTFDIAHTSKRSIYYEWFAKNASEYGFVMNGTSGRLRYVGIPHAVYMNENSLFLSEYIATLRGHTVENPVEITVNGVEYGIYYVKASDGAVSEITLPIGAEYTVSGDNSSGFIVTVKK